MMLQGELGIVRMFAHSEVLTEVSQIPFCIIDIICSFYDAFHLPARSP